MFDENLLSVDLVVILVTVVISSVDITKLPRAHSIRRCRSRRNRRPRAASSAGRAPS